jgi:hypothetical protein
MVYRVIFIFIKKICRVFTSRLSTKSSTLQNTYEYIHVRFFYILPLLASDEAIDCLQYTFF